MPKPKPIQISIPNPCHQSWDEMTPQGQGRHCAHCQKVVTDFTSWSDTALYEFLLKNKDVRICGRIYKSQLKYPIYPAKQSPLGISKWAAGLAIVIATLEVGTGFNTYARTPYVHTSPLYTNSDANIYEDKNEDGSNDTLIITGIITNQTQQPVFQAEIYLVNKNQKAIVGTMSNENGEFVIKISRPKKMNSLSLYVKQFDYVSTTIPLTSKKVNHPIYINLKYKDEIIMGMIGGRYYDVPMQPAPETKNKK